MAISDKDSIWKHMIVPMKLPEAKLAEEKEEEDIFISCPYCESENVIDKRTPDKLLYSIPKYQYRCRSCYRDFNY